MSDSAINIGLTLGTAWHVQHAKFITQIGYISGAGSPVSSATPAFIGQEYFDTSGNNWWRAYGLANTNWVQFGGLSESLSATTITATSHTALVVGQAGATNPALQIDTNTASSATGLKITSNAAGSGIAEVVTSSGSNENWTLDALGTGTMTLNGTATGLVIIGHGAKINAGSATLAPLTLTTGTVLTTPAAGAIEFDGTCFYGTAYASTRQVIDTEQVCILAADYTLTNGTSAQAALNSTTNGALTLQAGLTYAFEAAYLITNTGTTSHYWETLFGGTATITAINYVIQGNTLTANGAGTGGYAGWSNVGTAVQATAASTSATENAMILLQGTVTINAAGTFIPQIELSAAPGGAQKMKAGSFFRIWQMPGTGAVGDWS